MIAPVGRFRRSVYFMADYGQYCPVAKATEVLDQRWSLLIIRELLMGSSHVNDIRRGVPRMSPSLLSRRLRELVRQGMVARSAPDSFTLTAAGEALRPVLEALGNWGAKWRPFDAADCDPRLLMRDVARTLKRDRLPPSRTVLHFELTDAVMPERHWWLKVSPTQADLHEFNPGVEPDLVISTDVLTLARIWRGDVTWEAMRTLGRVRVTGPRELSNQLPHWWGTTPFVTTDSATAGSGGEWDRALA